MQENNQKTEYKRNLTWFLEVLIWFLLFVLIASAITVGKYRIDNQLNTYQIFINDVDGIIKGSPVRMMGIQVGYIKKVKIVGDMVFVEFTITQKGISLPKGSKVTVEFTGMGGSKSLEVYTPKEKVPEDTPFILVEQPRRLGAALSLLDSMLNKISSIIFKCSTFADSIDFVVKNKPELKKNPQDTINETNRWLDKALKNEEKINNTIMRYKK